MTPALYEALACTCEFEWIEDEDRLPRVVRFLDPACVAHTLERM